MIDGLLKSVNDNFFEKHKQFFICIEQTVITILSHLRWVFDVARHVALEVRQHLQTIGHPKHHWS